MRTDLVLDEMGARPREASAEACLLHHSDRGGQ